MKAKTVWILLGVSLVSSILMVGCFTTSTSTAPDGEVVTDSGIYFDIDSVDYSAITLSGGALAPGARLLASQCAQCHGTFGVAVSGWPELWGSGAVGNWMTVYQDPAYADNMMHLHALAYTPEEVVLIKSYYSKVNYTPAVGE